MITLSNTFGLNSNLYTRCALLKYINRPATHTDFISIYRFFNPSNLAKY